MKAFERFAMANELVVQLVITAGIGQERIAVGNEQIHNHHNLRTRIQSFALSFLRDLINESEKIELTH